MNFKTNIISDSKLLNVTSLDSAALDGDGRQSGSHTPPLFSEKVALVLEHGKRSSGGTGILIQMPRLPPARLATGRSILVASKSWQGSWSAAEVLNPDCSAELLKQHSHHSVFRCHFWRLSHSWALLGLVVSPISHGDRSLLPYQAVSPEHWSWTTSSG